MGVMRVPATRPLLGQPRIADRSNVNLLRSAPPDASQHRKDENDGPGGKSELYPHAFTLDYLERRRTLGTRASGSCRGLVLVIGRKGRAIELMTLAFLDLLLEISRETLHQLFSFLCCPLECGLQLSHVFELFRHASRTNFKLPDSMQDFFPT